METVTPRAAILRLPYYQPGERTNNGVPACKLSSNESALGPSPKAVDAYRDVMTEIHRYPDPDWIDLREVLAGHHGLDVRQIACGAGSEDLITTIAHTYLDPGDSAVHSEFGFPLYRIVTIACDATPIAAPEASMRADISALASAVRRDTKVVFLANPNNPTGTVLPFDEIRALHTSLPPTVLLVLDSAYAEYMGDDSAYDSGLQLVREGAENVVVTRTFSKIHGLAGLRIGWACACQEIIATLRRSGRTFGVNSSAQAAAAAAINDARHLELALKHNARWRGWLEGQLQSLGYETTRSAANFVLFNLSGDDAASAFQHLKSRGVIVRPAAPYGLPYSLRVTVGLETENHAFIEALREFRRRS